jgi:hypothetical protein
VVASGPGNVTAANFEGVTDDVARLVKKGKNTLKLSSGKDAGLKVPFVTFDSIEDAAVLPWAPTSEGDSLIIKCLRGSYIPQFHFLPMP